MPRLSNEIAIHLEKARDSALLAVETYNRPRSSFRSGGYIVLMCIAWTALFHAIFFKRRIKPFYRKKTHRRHFEMLEGDRKAWELATCVGQFWGAGNPPARLNLEFFLRLRNKIEHRSMPGLDIDIFGECQALLFNFEDLLVAEFGDRYAINESLSLALQFSCYRNERQEQATRKLHIRLARDIRAYIDAFRTSLSIEQLQDMRFSYKVFMFPKPANRERGADLAVEFVRYDPADPEEMARMNRAVALIKPATAPTPQVGGPIVFGNEGLAVRVVDNPDAVALQRIDYDVTHPHRQMDLLRRLKALLPDDTPVSTYDLTAVRYAHQVRDSRDYYYKSRFGSAQYSESYAQWIVQNYLADPQFFFKARHRYQNEHR